jgi:Alpha/beta hydrolase family
MAGKLNVICSFAYLLAIAFCRASVCEAADARVARPGPKDLPVIAGLPDPLTAKDGQKVTTAEQWRKQREEMKAILEEYEFGHTPPPPGNVKGQEVSSTTLTNSGVEYKRIRLRFGPEEKLGFDLGVFTPPETNGSRGPYPIIIHLSFFPPAATSATNSPGQTNTARRFLSATPEIAAGQYRAALGRGYAVVTINYQQLGADNTNYRSSPFFQAYPDYDWRDIAAWAWGISRCVDYLQDAPFADKAKVVLVGHSRMGQAVLLAGAFDERISLVAPAGAGCAFRFCGKGRGGKQGIDEICDQNTYWFGPRLPEFYGQTEKLPCDQNWLIALAAPRPYILADGLDDQYVNGNAVAQSYLGAKPVYELLGVPDKLGINFRPGQHILSATDWQAILDFADQQLRGRDVKRRFDALPPADQLH